MTSQYDNNRDGYNPHETKITPANIFTNGLTLLAPLLVDTPPSSVFPAWMSEYGIETNLIYAQPLYTAGITVNSGGTVGQPGNCTSAAGEYTCNMLVAETLYGSVWAWNADTGNLIFSRQGTTNTAGQNALWYDDCPNPAIPKNGQGGVGSLPFAGIVSTPVIDPTIAVPSTGLYGVMFLTSLCRDTQSATSRWYLHELDLTNGLLDVSGSNSPVQMEGSATNNSSVTFAPGSVLQRSALLEVRNSSATPSNVIYAPFGSAVPEASTSYPYDGWLFGYSVSGSVISTTPDFIFDTTPTGPSGNTGSPGCYCPSSCANAAPTSYQTQPNWCGHGGGIWMSSRGMAANTVSGVSNAFVGVGNGAFQTSSLNWGSSVLDFTYSTSGVGASPSQSFTPQGGLFAGDLLGNGTTNLITNCGTTGSPAACTSTVESLNQNDWDMSASGILLFTDSDGNNWLLTIDKGGLGYLLKQSSLGGYTSNDAGNQFPFAAASEPCWTLGVSNASGCHRITSMAFYNNTLYYGLSMSC